MKLWAFSTLSTLLLIVGAPAADDAKTASIDRKAWRERLPEEVRKKVTE